MSNTTNIASASSRKESRMAYSTPRLSTLMSKHSPVSLENCTVDVSMSLEGDFLASRFHSPADNSQQTTHVTCGLPPPKSFARFDHDTHSWKTSQACLDLGMDTLDTYSEIWPSSGIMRDGECYRLPPLERHTCASGCGSWPTPRACDADKGIRTPDGAARERDRRKNGLDLPTMVGGKLNPEFVEWLMGWARGWSCLTPITQPIDTGNQWDAEWPGVNRVTSGTKDRVARLKALGNGQVPLCAASAWRMLTDSA